MSMRTNSPKGSKSIWRSSRLVVSSWKLTTKRVSEGDIFLRRSSSLRLMRPSPRANSARRALEMLLRFIPPMSATYCSTRSFSAKVSASLRKTKQYPRFMSTRSTAKGAGRSPMPSGSFASPPMPPPMPVATGWRKSPSTSEARHPWLRLPMKMGRMAMPPPALPLREPSLVMPWPWPWPWPPRESWGSPPMPELGGLPSSRMERSLSTGPRPSECWYMSSGWWLSWGSSMVELR
mmetsp:Transcript_1952/g.4229  ORF Transcript_1952/g.4229 Transcript_1952/m.4229 type:complete len:235 (-) Transcript_1952:89-793(-)